MESISRGLGVVSCSNVFNQDFNSARSHFMWLLGSAWEGAATLQEIISLSSKLLIIFKVIIPNSLLGLHVLAESLLLPQPTSYD